MVHRALAGGCRQEPMQPLTRTRRSCGSPAVQPALRHEAPGSTLGGRKDAAALTGFLAAKIHWSSKAH